MLCNQPPNSCYHSVVVNSSISAGLSKLHAHEFGRVATAAKQYVSDIRFFVLDHQGMPVATAMAESSRSLQSLSRYQGEQIVIAAFGNDAQVAVDEISSLLASIFCIDQHPTDKDVISCIPASENS
jgi:phosphotransferase system HPr-like phosphotransfer protein